MFLAVLGVVLLAGSVVTTAVFGTQASVIGVDNFLQVQSVKVNDPQGATSVSVSVKNTRTSSVSFFAIKTVYYMDIPDDVYLPFTLDSQTIAASETKTITLQLPCKYVTLKCNSNGSYKTGYYTVELSFWMLATSQPAKCATEPLAFECGYVQISPKVFANFNWVPPPPPPPPAPAPSIKITVLACYEWISGIPQFCAMNADGYGALTTPSFGLHTYTSLQDVTFTATPVKDKNTFVKWIASDGISEGKFTESTQNPFTAKIQDNAVYVALFKRVSLIDKPKLAIMVTKPESCTTTPTTGVYEKTLGDKLTITMTPAKNLTSTDGKSTSVSAIIGYTIQKSNSPIPDSTYFKLDNPMVLGSMTEKTTKEITMDVDTTVIVSCGSSTTFKFPDGEKPAPKPGPIGGLPGVPSVGGLQILPLGLGVAGAISLFGSFFMGRKGVGL